MSNENGSTTDNAPAKIDKAVRREQYNFQYIFSPEELEHKSRQLAKACQDRDAIEDELKSIKAEFKAKTEAKTSEINLLANHINNGHEWLYKSCIVQFDFDRGRKYYFYEGVKVGDEKMQAADYQLKADLPEYRDGDARKNPWELDVEGKGPEAQDAEEVQ